jgi:hypothetical protein
VAWREPAGCPRHSVGMSDTWSEQCVEGSENRVTKWKSDKIAAMAFNPSLTRRVSFFAAWLSAVTSLYGQTKTDTKPEPNVLIFTNGDKLTGHLVRSAGWRDQRRVEED